MSAREERHRLAVNKSILGRQPADRLRDVGKPAGEICPVSAPHIDALALLSGERSEAVVLDLMQPARPGRRIGDKSRPTGHDETSRRWASKTRGIMPRHVSVRRASLKSSTGPSREAGAAITGGPSRVQNHLVGRCFFGSDDRRLGSVMQSALCALAPIAVEGLK